MFAYWGERCKEHRDDKAGSFKTAGDLERLRQLTAATVRIWPRIGPSRFHAINCEVLAQAAVPLSAPDDSVFSARSNDMTNGVPRSVDVRRSWR